jgi:hypothetical protein
MAAHGGDVWARRGLGTLDPARAFAALERLLAEDATCAAVLAIDWPRFLATLPAGLARGFFRALEGGPAAAPPAAAATLGATLAALPAGQRRAALAAGLGERALQVIGLPAGTALDPRVPLKEVGLDSLMAVELRNTLARATGLPLPATLLFDYPTLEALAGQLARVLGLEEPEAPEGRAAAPARSGADALAALSDDEAEQLLLEELGRGHGPGQRR